MQDLLVARLALPDNDNDNTSRIILVRILNEVAARWLDEGDTADSKAFTRPRLSLHTYPCDAISPALKAISDPRFRFCHSVDRVGRGGRRPGWRPGVHVHYD
jgi:hypothetical protein